MHPFGASAGSSKAVIIPVCRPTVAAPVGAASSTSPTEATARLAMAPRPALLRKPRRLNEASVPVISLGFAAGRLMSKPPEFTAGD
jgi:hypothetical protein